MKDIKKIRVSKEKGSLYIFSKEAQNFIEEKKWCLKVEKGYLGIGIDGILAVFKFYITPTEKDIDSELWVIVGDIPPAYLVIDRAPDAISALIVYVEEMRLWVNASFRGSSVDGLIPVNVVSNQENAEKLKKRLDFIEQKIIPIYSKDNISTVDHGEENRP
jgi:hypothetical protein